MAKKIVYEIEVKEGDSVKTIQKTADTLDNLDEAAKSYQEQLKKAVVGSEEFKKVNKNLEEVKDAQEKALASTRSFTENLEQIPGPIGQVAQGITGLGKAAKIFAANPIFLALTALVGTLKLLFNAFTSTKEGTEALQRVTAGLSAAMDVLRDVAVKVAEVLINAFKNPKQALIDLGNAIKENITNRLEGLVEFIPQVSKAINLLFQRNFKEAGKVAADAMGKVVLGVEDVTDKAVKAGEAIANVAKEAQEEAKEAARLTGVLQRITDAERELNVTRAEQNAELQKTKLLVEDTTLSYDDRLRALDEVSKKEIETTNQELKLAQDRLNALEKLASLSDSNAETLDEIAQQRIKIANLEQQSAAKLTEATTKRNSLLQQQKADLKAVADLEQQLNIELIDDEIKKQEMELEIQRNAQLQSIDQLKTSEEKKNELRLLAEMSYQDQLTELRKQKEEERIAAELEREKRRIDAKIELLKLEIEEQQMVDEEDLLRYEELLRAQTDLLLQNDELTAEERELIEEQYSQAIKDIRDQKAKNAQDNADKEKQAEYEKANAAVSALGTIASAAGAETAVGKAAGVAQATVNTYLAASQALADKTIPTFLKPFLVAAQIALGLKQVSEIAGVGYNIPKPSVPAPQKLAMGGIVSGQGTVDSDNINVALSPGESVINASSTAAFAPLLSRINELGGGSAFNMGVLDNQVTSQVISDQRPVKAYVVSSDMSNQQQIDRRIKDRSVI